MGSVWNGLAFNFASLGGVDAWFYKSLAGINPDENDPGFRKMIIKPEVVGDLTWVKTSYDSQYGAIGSEWKIRNDSLMMDITIPVNTTAVVYIPCENIEVIKESGKPVTRSRNISLGKTEKGKTILEVGSGRYRFTVPFLKK
ncbi:MAG: alpha-L-rhamnosidase C-terminal domain-containing protein [Mangrovibacterium sp.]